MNDRPKFTRSAAIQALNTFLGEFRLACARCEVAGSLRRERPTVGDIEIVFIPFYDQRREGLFDTTPYSLADETLCRMIGRGVLAKRKNVNGSQMWGDKNKLAVHIATGIPVDFFATEQDFWFSYLACRTGPKESNIALAMAFQRHGWKWHPYRGVEDSEGHMVYPSSEQDLFRLAGLPYREPCDRK